VKLSAIQIFVVLAVVVGLLVSYYPPAQNAVAIWLLISNFLSFVIRDLLDHFKTQNATDAKNSVAAPDAAPAPTSTTL
jgi:hypothetical protein